MLLAATDVEEKAINTLIWLGLAAGIVFLLSRRRKVLTSCGTAEWASDKLLSAWGMLSNQGLILGRTLKGALIRIPRYNSLLLIGSTGSGKGIGIIIPNLLTYFRGSLVVFDTKGDLFETTALKRHQAGQTIIRLAPFSPENTHTWNPLDTIPADDPLLIDSSRAMAEALVVREHGDRDPHWNSRAVQIITGILVLVLRLFHDEERNLGSVQEIASDPRLLSSSADRLRQMGGIAARLGNQIAGLFETGTLLTKEGASVVSTIVRHLSFLDSDMVASSVATSAWDVRQILKPGTTLYLTIPPQHLEAQKNLLRCWISTLIRVIGASGSEMENEVFMMLDEASALGSLAAVEEALVRGRSAGVRMLLAYQSSSQVTTAFPDKPSLLYDNCGVQIHMGPPSSYEHAERLSKSLGDWTQVVENDGDNWSSSASSQVGQGGSTNTSYGGSKSRNQQGRALLRPEELLTMGEKGLIAFIRGMPAPILARRVEWFADPVFNPAGPKTRPNLWAKGTLTKVDWIVIVALCLFFGGIILQAKIRGTGAWAPEIGRR